MKSADWKLIGYIGIYIGIALGMVLLIIGCWIWLNVAGYMGYRGWLEYHEFRGHVMSLLILGLFFLIASFVLVWRAAEERKHKTEVKMGSSSNS